MKISKCVIFLVLIFASFFTLADEQAQVLSPVVTESKLVLMNWVEENFLALTLGFVVVVLLLFYMIFRRK